MSHYKIVGAWAIVILQYAYIIVTTGFLFYGTFLCYKERRWPWAITFTGFILLLSIIFIHDVVIH